MCITQGMWQNKYECIWTTDDVCMGTSRTIITEDNYKWDGITGDVRGQL